MKKTAIIIAMLMLAAFGAKAVNIIHGPYLQNVTESEATFVWISDSTTVGWVEIAPDDGSHFYQVPRPKYFDSRAGIKTESRIHAVRVKGLAPGTKYRYRVYAREVLKHKGNYVEYGRTTATQVYQKEPLAFSTLDPAAGSVNFAMVNDIHGNVEKLRTLAFSMNSRELTLKSRRKTAILSQEQATTQN